jgi:uncharacterized repeat protein (TIGR02543 family)
MGIAVDSIGNVYIADRSNGRVLMETLVNTAGVISYNQTIVASGLENPDCVAADGNGSVYIADTGHNQVLKETPVNTGGVISYTPTTVGSGFAWPAGVAVDGNGNVYIADRANNEVWLETLVNTGGVSSYNQTLVASGLNGPYGVAVDGSGTVYIADTFNNRVLMGTPTQYGNSTETLVAGSLNYPYGVAVDANGNVYITDSRNNQVLKETLANGGYTQTTVASGLNYPEGVAVAGNGNVYIADMNNNRALKLDLADSPTLAFPANDAPQTATIQNIGNAPLVFSNTPSPASPFTLDSSSTFLQLESGTLAPNQSATLVVDFLPTSASPFTRSLALIDNHLNQQPSATQNITLNGTGLITMTPATLPGGAVYGANYSTTISATGGTGPYTFTVYSGSLPAGLSLTGGTISGSPSSPGSSSFSITATDSNGATCTTAYGLTVGQGTGSVILGSLAQTYTGSPRAATATTVPSAMTVTFTYNGSATAPTAPGSYTVVGTLSNTDYSGSATGTLVISPAISANPSYTVTFGTGGTTTATLTGTTSQTLASGASCSAVTANAPAGYVFVNWTGTNGFTTSTANPLTVTNVTAAYAITANFSANAVVITTPPAPTLTVQSGGTATTTLTLSGQGSVTNPVTLTATGLPPGATCTFSNNAMTVSGGPATVNVTITTTANLQIIGQNKGFNPLGGFGAGVGALLACGILIPGGRRRKRFGLFLSALLMVLVGGLTACSSNSSSKTVTSGSTGTPAGTPAGTYTVTLTASSQGATEASSTIQLTVH